MEWIDSVKEIKKAQENNQLVIFVGSGVSNNSNVPTWGALIRKFADKIGYDKCISCKKAGKTCPKPNCEDRYAFTQDEYLRIPEYYFQSDTSEEKADYYQIIQSTLKCDNGPNSIDDEIFTILPHHIITTNYDSLLEDSTNLNSQLYTVVSQDSDLLSKASDRYIIKMHGDLKAPDTIVLKESDYIDYEQKHPLISTFIRSLLVNHTFVFLGYSLNDYNLNLIIGWINYFKKIYDVAERPHSFLVASHEPSDFEKARLEDKNIYVVDISSLPDDLLEKTVPPTSLPNLTGKKLYAFLRCITESQILQHYISLSQILSEKYQILKSYKKISFEDLIHVHPFGHTSFISTELVFYDKIWYEKIAALLSAGDEELIDTFTRAGLSRIHLFEDDSTTDIPSPVEINEEDTLLKLYLDNDYIELSNHIELCKNTGEKIYFYHLLGKSTTEIEEIIALEESSIELNDYVAILLHKMRIRLVTMTFIDRQDSKTKELEQLFDTAPIKYRNAINYLKMLFESSAKNEMKMEQQVEEQEKRYEYRSNAWYSGHSYTHIWNLQAYAYDYYFFFKENYLPFDYFSDPSNYLFYYLKAILCSYSPIALSEPNTRIGLSTDRRHYPLNEIDLDMFVKYMTSRSLKSLLKKYSVQFLEIDKDMDIVQKYKNLCSGFAHFKHRRWYDHLYNFTIIICLVELDKNSKKEIFVAMTHMVKMITKDSPKTIDNLFESVNHLVKNITIKEVDKAKSDLLDTILMPNVYPLLVERHRASFSYIVKELSPYIKIKTQKRLIAEIDSIEDKKDKIKKVYLFRHLIPMEQYSNFINDNYELISTESVFHLLIEKILSPRDAVFQIFIDIIAEEDKKRQSHPGMRTSPDWLMVSIEECIILKLFDFNIDLALLEPYSHYSEHLQFMLNPDEFDYSRVDISHYMWENLIYSSNYKKYFIAHKAELLSDDLRKIFDMGLETKDQQKIVYGLLLDEKDLRSF